jgi:hypothetical protein
LHQFIGIVFYKRWSIQTVTMRCTSYFHILVAHQTWQIKFWGLRSEDLCGQYNGPQMIQKPGSSNWTGFTDVPGCITRLKWSFGTHTVNPVVKSLCISHILIIFCIQVTVNSITLNKLTYIYMECLIGIDLRNMILETTQVVNHSVHT